MGGMCKRASGGFVRDRGEQRLIYETKLNFVPAKSNSGFSPL